MKKICGVELTGSKAIFCLLECDGESWEVLTVPTRKLALDDSRDADHVRSTKQILETFFREHAPDLIGIKQRNERGQFAGGAVTFKLEGLIQVATNTSIEFVAPNAISHTLKDKEVDYPSDLYAYQEEAFRTALTLHFRSA